MFCSVDSILQFDADEFSSCGDYWSQLRPLFGAEMLAAGLILIQPAEGSSVVLEVLNLYWKLYQRASPRQASELLVDVLEALVKISTGCCFEMGRSGVGIGPSSQVMTAC